MMTKLTIIYAPDIDPDLLHFSRDLESQSARLRKYPDPRNCIEIREYENKKSEIEKRIKEEYELESGERRNLNDKGYWYDYIHRLKRIV